MTYAPYDKIRMTIGNETVDCFVFERTDATVTIYREFLDCGKPEKLETYNSNEVTAEVIERGGAILHWASEEAVDAMIRWVRQRRSNLHEDDIFGGNYNAT